MFEQFGEMDSWEELNLLATNLKSEGDTESIKSLAKENGIDTAEYFIKGDIPDFCDPLSAALGKIEIECKALKPKQIMKDWVEYIKARCFEDEEFAKAVRKKGKDLNGAIAALLEWSFKNQITIKKEILQAAKVHAGKVTLGIPGMAEAKKIITEYYTGGKA